MVRRVLFLVFVAELLSALGEIWLKKAANALEPPHFKGLAPYLRYVVRLFAVPWVWLGLGAMGMGLVGWLAALAQADLSWVYPLSSMQYVLVLVIARLWLGERIDRMKLIGTLLLCAGILITAQS